MGLLNSSLMTAGALLLVTLTGCGGGDSSEVGSNVLTGGSTPNGVFSGGGDEGTGDEGGDEDSGDTSEDVTGVSYVPQLVFDAFEEYSGDGNTGFSASTQFPYIDSLLINPIDSVTLQSVTNAQATDYKLTVDEVELDFAEVQPMLQPVIGLDFQLVTALVFDLSDSTRAAEVDIQALVDEAKAYVDQAQASSNPTVANQAYTVWAFGYEVMELTSGFTLDNTEIDTALDAVVTNFNSGDLLSISNLNRAIVEVVGRYSDDNYDFGSDNNDLLDFVLFNGGVDRGLGFQEFIQLSQLVLFATGPDTASEFDFGEMIRAIESQSLVRYDPDAVATADSDGTIRMGKPVFYYSVEGTGPANTIYEELQDNAEVTRVLPLGSNAYDFADTLIQDQLDSVERRFESGVQYLFRYASPMRQGDHVRVFSSNTTNNNYALTRETERDDLASDPEIGTPQDELDNPDTHLVEIAGPNGEYICNDTINFSEAQTFTAMTLWTTGSYDASDYSWSISSGTMTQNSDGSVTVNSVTGASATLTLTNNALPGTTANPSTNLYIMNN